MSKSSKSDDEPKPTPTWFDPAYAAECEARSRKIRITYVDVERWNTARLVHSWKRDDADIRRGPIMSTSSGPKENTINLIIGLFDSNETIEQIAMLVLNGVPFVIYRIGKFWYDAGGKPEPRLVRVEAAHDR